jgi:hypothetical protein
VHHRFKRKSTRGKETCDYVRIATLVSAEQFTEWVSTDLHVLMTENKHNSTCELFICMRIYSEDHNRTGYTRYHSLFEEE